MAASREELLRVDEVGDKIADSILDFFSRPEHREIIARLKACGVRMEVEKRGDRGGQGGALSGLSLVVSGKFSIAREELKELIERHGGRNVSSVSASTDYLVAGEAMGPAKAQKAEKLGVKVISETQLYALIGTEGSASSQMQEDEPLAEEKNTAPQEGQTSLF